MKKIIIAMSAFALLAFMFISCKKSKEAAPTVTPTVTTISGSYAISKVTLKNNATGQEQVQSYPDCKKDDQENFNSDLTFNYVDAGVVCQTPGDWSGAWGLTNSSTIEIDGSPFTIVLFDGTNLNLSTDFDADNKVITYLIKK
jgi:hypothetical protein